MRNILPISAIILTRSLLFVFCNALRLLMEKTDANKTIMFVSL